MINSSTKSAWGSNGVAQLVFVAEANEPLTDYPMGETRHFQTH